MRRALPLVVALLSLASCGTSEPGPAAEGAAIAEEKGCVSCHSTDGTKGIGPTWRGLYGAKVEFIDGTSVVADDAYLRESMLDPSRRTVQGFSEGTMEKAIPAGSLTDDEVAALIRYIRSLR